MPLIIERRLSMKIEEKDKTIKKFGDIVPGECFTVNKKTYLKTETKDIDNDNVFNSVCLTDNKITFFHAFTEVEPFKSATLYYVK